MPPTRTMSVDLSWRKREFHIKDTHNSNPSPLYTIHCHSHSDKALSIHSDTTDQLIGTSKIHSATGGSTYKLYGYNGSIQAEKQAQTSYTFLSWAYSTYPGTPVQMSWISRGGLKTWDFVCVNDRQETVAKFSANMWAMKNVGTIEMTGPKAWDRTACDEIVVVGLTLYYGWLMRVTGLSSDSMGSSLLSMDKKKKKDKSGKQGKTCYEELGEVGDAVGILNDLSLIG
ncbi:Uncharacterized protein PECH_003247 [Penicillium ucsense]|uniref:Uncharacterized protein n=1 Tax=Penicillium ucsense TaxID=2839758 RepID=A0A8J8VZG6_9EURO|nr:Uncharacterized protein PECM_002788 [Penicillium ucsense]KAF7729705.1 Uncharacterized protein PECH_003247 [Penicillium ucsense]